MYAYNYLYLYSKFFNYTVCASVRLALTTHTEDTMSENYKTKTRHERNLSALRAELALIILFVITALILAVMLVFCYSNGYDSAFKLGIMLCIAYVCAFGILLVISVLKSSAAAKKQGKLGARGDQFPLATLAKLEQPTAVCDDSGSVVWMNDKFSKRSEKQVLISENLTLADILSFRDCYYCDGQVKLERPDETRPRSYEYPERLSLTELLDLISQNRLGVTAKGQRNFVGDYTLHAYPHFSNKKKFYIIVLTDDTELNDWILQYNNNLTHIAYITVDNLDELAQSDQAGYREASIQTARVIKQWATDNLAFLREYERGKYIAVMTHKTLSENTSNGFPLLNSVREIRAGADDLAVTISAGVSSETGKLEDKDNEAQYALDMALARGGNQAVVMSAEAPSFYGGKTTTVLKRSGVKERVFAEKLRERIKKSRSILIMGHRSPDFDAIGSCVGLARLVMSIDKRYPYRNGNVDLKRSIHIVIGDTSPTIEECKLKLSGIEEYSTIFTDVADSHDILSAENLLICSDVNNLDNFITPSLAAQVSDIFIIDHHRQSEKTPKNSQTLIVPSASSASELVAKILGFVLPEGDQLYPEEADIMYAGMLLDTKNFTRNTQIPTFDAAIYLRNSGADPNRAHALFKLDIDGFRAESAFSTDLETYREDIIIAKETGSESSPQKRITAAKTADKLLNIKNIKVSFVVTRMQNDVFISSRSDGSVNVQLIMEQLKGGGHYNAAATMLKDISVDTAVEKLKKAIDDYFSDGQSGVTALDVKRIKGKQKSRRRATKL